MRRPMKSTNPIYTGLPTTIFEVMSRLAIEHKAINLGQGFPDVDGPEDIRRFAAEALIAGPNQYPPMMGVPELRQAVAEPNRALLRPRRRLADARCWSPPAPPRRSPTASPR